MDGGVAVGMLTKEMARAGQLEGSVTDQIAAPAAGGLVAAPAAGAAAVDVELDHGGYPLQKVGKTRTVAAGGGGLSARTDVH